MTTGIREGFEELQLRRGKNVFVLEVTCSTMAALKFSGAPSGTKLRGAFWGAQNIFPNAPTDGDVVELDKLLDGRFVLRPTGYDPAKGYEIEGHQAMSLTLRLEAVQKGMVLVVVEPEGVKRP